MGIFDDQLLGIPVRLWYTMVWPLDFFISDEDLTHYSDVFAFLLTVRKGQVRLQKAWIDIKSMTQRMTNRKRRDNLTKAHSRHIKTPDDDIEEYEQEAEILKHIATMRSDMIFVVDCLWAYIQVGKITTNYHVEITTHHLTMYSYTPSCF